MHLSDTLVIGPLPLQRRFLRLPVGAAVAGLLALLVAGATTALLTRRPLPTAVAALAARLPVALQGVAPATASAPPSVPIRVASVPPDATILLDGQVLGKTPATVAVPEGHPVVLR